METPTSAYHAKDRFTKEDIEKLIKLPITEVPSGQEGWKKYKYFYGSFDKYIYAKGK